MNLKQKLLSYILIVTGSLVIVVSAIGYWNAKQQLTQDINIQMASIADMQVQQLDSWLMGKAKTIQDLAFIVENTTSGDVPESYVTMDKKDKTISDIYIGFAADGKFLEGAKSELEPGYDPRKRPWYQSAATKNGLVFSEPYIDSNTHKYCVSPALPIRDGNGNIRGVVGMDILLETLTEISKNVNLDGKGYAFIIDSKGIVLAHPDDKLISTSILENGELKDAVQQMLNKESGTLQYILQNEKKLMVFRKVPSTGWMLALTVSEAEVYAPLTVLKNTYLIVILFALLIAGVFATILARKITKPIAVLTDNARKMAEGDLTVRGQVEGKDEIAQLAQAFNQMGDNLRGLTGEISQMVLYLTKAAADMHTAAGEAGQVSEQIAISITDMAQDAARQANIIQNSAFLVTDMTKSVNVITRNISGSSCTAGQVREAVQTGSKAITSQSKLMEDTQQACFSVNQAISALSDKSQQIGQIVEVISSIAGQTNLLALNAAIEAARAGEHGRGFAVVAEEVRKLAEQAGNSSQEISNLIREIQVGTNQAVNEMANVEVVGQELQKAAALSRQAFSNINSSVNEIIAQVQEISLETQQVDGKTGEVSQSIDEVASVSENSAAVTEEVAAATEEQTASVQAISQEAQKLLEQAEKLKQAITQFTI